jgi:predicted DNA-binding transcriptional regulator YafY
MVRSILEGAVRRAQRVWIRYRNARGYESARVVDPDRVEGGFLWAFCELSDDLRCFRLDRVIEVSTCIHGQPEYREAHQV